MRTNIEIDDGLIAAAMRWDGHPAKKAAVEEGLRLVARLARQGEAAQVLWGGGTEWGLAARPALLLHEEQAPLR